MENLKGYRLYVRLGASQTRRRLKGFGHGVRKVQSAGRHQAVVIHTATGAHLAALMAQLADVGCGPAPLPESSEPEKSGSAAHHETNSVAPKDTNRR